MATLSQPAPAVETGPTSAPARAPAEAVPMPTLVGPRGAIRPISAEEFGRMVEAEILAPDRQVELWEGLLVEKLAKKQAHANAQSAIHEAFVACLIRNLPGQYFAASEYPVLLDDDKVPLPDVVVVRGRRDQFGQRPPGPADVALVVEVADTSLRKDTEPSLRAYAARGIPVYWVVNIPGRRVEVYSRPTARDGVGEYESLVACGPGDEVPVVLDGRDVARVPTREILPTETAS